MTLIASSVGTIVVSIHNGDALIRVQFADAWVETELRHDAFSVYGTRHGLSGLLLGRFNARAASWHIEPAANPQGPTAAAGASTYAPPGHVLDQDVLGQVRGEVRFACPPRFILHGWGRLTDSLFAGVVLLDSDEALGPATLRAALVDDGTPLCLTYARAGLCQCRSLVLTPISRSGYE
mgnify:CR=1 FL=1